MDNGRQWKLACTAVAACAAVLCVNVPAYAGEQSAQDTPARDTHGGARAHHGEPERAASKAQSGAEAADEARIYTAQLRRCEGLSGAQRETCVDAAKRRLGEL